VGFNSKSNSNKDSKSTHCSSRALDFLSKTDLDRELKKSVSPAILEPACESINVLLEIMYIHGLYRPSTQDKSYQVRFKNSVVGTLLRLSKFHEKIGLSESWIKYWKYKLNAYFYAAEDAGSLDKAPVCPIELADDNPLYLFGGIIGQWMQSYNHKNKHSTLNLSILMAKKGMPRASEDMIREAEDKTLKALTSSREQHHPQWRSLYKNDDELQAIYKFVNGTAGFHPSIVTTMSGYIRNLGRLDEDWTINQFNLNQHCDIQEDAILRKAPRNLDRSDLEKQLRRTAREVYHGKKFTVRDMSEPVLASGNGNYNNSKGKGGAIGHFKRVFNLERYDVSNYERFLYANMDLGQETTELYGPRGKRDQQRLDQDVYVKHTSGYIYNSSYITMAYRQWYWQNFKAAMLEQPIVKPVGLAEPLKIRVISKGPPHTYHALKPLQQFMWKVLKDLKQFELIGRPIHVQDVEALGIGMEDWINSGDYQSSTDNFHSWVSEVMLDEVAKVLKLPYQLTELAKRALTRHIFEDRDGNLLEQKRGQLMGSIISFPFLCVANAAISRFSLELAERRTYTLKQCRMKINGDDSLIISKSKDFHDIWLQVSLVCGLESSVGKTYFNQKFCVINSCHFDRVPIDGPHPYGYAPLAWKQRAYVNGTRPGY
jgi:hypothetical protein